MKAKKPVGEVSTEKYIVLCNETFNWCINNFGSSDKNINPSIKISFDKRVTRSYGSYINGVITIYPNVCKTTKFIIQTILHEYRHFLQMPTTTNMEIYNTFSKNFKYIEHPLEIDSAVFEQKHYRNCKAFLEKKGII